VLEGLSGLSGGFDRAGRRHVDGPAEVQLALRHRTATEGAEEGVAGTVARLAAGHLGHPHPAARPVRNRLAAGQR
jgi:hypothetical protein